MTTPMVRLRVLASAAVRRLGRAPAVSLAAPAPPPGEPVETVDFVCNVCAGHNAAVPLHHVQNREGQSCRHCHSSLRMRSLVHALSLELFGQSLTLPDFPEDKTIHGLGMSDWEGYANRLAEKFSYTNTYYHTEPFLDITQVPEARFGTQRFLISSDVFEHIPGFALAAAFRNARRLLDDRGFFLLTVPFVKSGVTQEHYPRLHDFRIIETAGKRFVYNRTVSGEEEIFDNPVFHGGDGMTLEMRMFSEPDLRRHLETAGFPEIRIYADQYPEFGILWPIDWAVPIVARTKPGGRI